MIPRWIYNLMVEERARTGIATALILEEGTLEERAEASTSLTLASPGYMEKPEVNSYQPQSYCKTS